MNVELSLLATMLKKGDFGPLKNGEIKEEHFGTDQAQNLFNFVTNFRNETGGKAQYPSLDTVRSRFKHLELPDPDEGATVEDLTYTVRDLKMRSDLRNLALEMSEIADSTDPPLTVLGTVMSRLRTISETTLVTDHVSFDTSIEPTAELYRNGKLTTPGIDWPWPLMTEATHGIHKQEMIVIAGRPKSRKTFTALRVGVHAVKHCFKRVLIFSPEMPTKQMFMRCVAHFCDLPYAELKGGTMDEAQAMLLFEAAKKYGRLKGMDDDKYFYELKKKIPGLGDARPSLDIVHSAGQDMEWMRAQIELYRPDIVIADSLYRQRATGYKRNDTDHKAITALSREAKDIASTCNVAMIITHQLNREAQRSVGDISNLSWADGFAQDADGIYRVVTGTVNGADTSALLTLGARDVKWDGILIRNQPCYDYSEIGKIVDIQQVADLMKQEGKASQDEANANLRDRASSTPKGRVGSGKRSALVGMAQGGGIRRPPVNINAFMKERQNLQRKAQQMEEVE